MNCNLKGCKSNAEYIVHRDGGLNLKYCNFHKEMAIELMTKIDIPLRIQSLITVQINGDSL